MFIQTLFGDSCYNTGIRMYHDRKGGSFLDRIGKKILATGNGRCNLTNAQISPGHYHTQNTARLNDLLADMPAERPLAFFRELGLYCTEEDRGRIYPYSRQASMVLDVLKLALQRHHIQVQHNCKVKSLSVQKKVFTAQTESGQIFHADAVILARHLPRHAV